MQHDHAQPLYPYKELSQTKDIHSWTIIFPKDFHDDRFCAARIWRLPAITKSSVHRVGGLPTPRLICLYYQPPTKETLPMNPTSGAMGGAAAATSAAAAKTLLGPENTVTTCQFCHASIKTAVKYTVTTRTHIAAMLCCMICCCCCIPYCSNSAKNSDHYCPNCQKYLGTYEK